MYYNNDNAGCGCWLLLLLLLGGGIFLAIVFSPMFWLIVLILFILSLIRGKDEYQHRDGGTGGYGRGENPQGQAGPRVTRTRTNTGNGYPGETTKTDLPDMDGSLAGDVIDATDVVEVEAEPVKDDDETV